MDKTFVESVIIDAYLLLVSYISFTDLVKHLFCQRDTTSILQQECTGFCHWLGPTLIRNWVSSVIFIKNNTLKDKWSKMYLLLVNIA